MDTFEASLLESARVRLPWPIYRLHLTLTDGDSGFFKSYQVETSFRDLDAEIRIALEMTGVKSVKLVYVRWTDEFTPKELLLTEKSK